MVKHEIEIPENHTVPEDFLGWLRFRKHRVVGETGNWRNCPLTNWLRHIKEDPNFDKVIFDIDGWMARVMGKVDSISGIPGTKVRGKDVLKVMEV